MHTYVSLSAQQGPLRYQITAAVVTDAKTSSHSCGCMSCSRLLVPSLHRVDSRPLSACYARVETTVKGANSDRAVRPFELRDV